MKPESLKEYFKTYGRGVGKLFVESITPQDGDFKPIFTMSDKETEDLYSFKNLYMKYYSDPTETKFVDAVLAGRFDLLRAIEKNKVLGDYYRVIRDEAHARYLSDTYRAIKQLADNSDPKTAIGALKFLCSAVKGVEETATATRGRPSKKEIQQRTNEILSEDKEIQEAFARVQGLN
jgi:hypothetical protein